MKKEEWREIEYRGVILKVSSHGRIGRKRFIDRVGMWHNSIIYKPQTNSCGYYHVSISINGKTKFPMIHRLVGFGFVDNPRECKEIDHIDNDKTNNYYENLQWVTRKENNAKMVGLLKNMRKFSRDEYLDITRSHKAGVSINRIAKKYSVNRHKIRTLLFGNNYHKKYGENQLQLF